VAGRHEDHQPVNVTPLHGLQLLGNALVMPSWDVDRVGVLSEGQQAPARQLLP
jgi:hypothetical protein